MSKELIYVAINGRRLLSFYYKGGQRIVEPHLLGLNQQNHAALSAWFVRGYSESGGGQGWREYLLQDMSNVQVLNETFSGTRPKYNRNDTRMNQILCRI